jgi:hypothetical protein
MALVLTIGMVACGAPASSEVKADSTATDSTKVDTAVVAPVADTTSVVK